MDKGEAAVAIAVLSKLVHEPGMSDSTTGRRSLSPRPRGRIAGQTRLMRLDTFQRVLAVQIGFRDAADRLSASTGQALDDRIERLRSATGHNEREGRRSQGSRPRSPARSTR